jgi:dTMP kinase
MIARGKFITLEGIDGAGKSSHLDHLRTLARAKSGGDVLLTHEPGATAFGQKLREVVLHHETSALAEALAMFADRSAHVEGDIEPALAAGMWVVCDRFSDSTYAYQCGGRGLDTRKIVALEQVVHPGLQPDATFLFDIDPAVAFERQRLRGGASDEFERRDAAYFVRVRNAYLQRAREHGARFHVIDASQSLEEVRAQVSDKFAKAFP